MNIDIVLSWPKEYIVYRDGESGNGNPHTGQGTERSGVSGLSDGFGICSADSGFRQRMGKR
jgi:hypothetical protein